MRAWSGPAILSAGFRPFFFLGGVWAALSMILWIATLTGVINLPTRFDPISWHAHEFMFGYLGAAVAGFLLTAVPNWTGRLPVVGWPLGVLAGLWILGRIAIVLSLWLPTLLVALTDLSFLIAFAGVILREIIAGKNWRNLPVVAMLLILLVGNMLFHWEAANGDYAAAGYGLRLSLAAAIMMISVIGGRVVPSFTRNWLVKAGDDARPTPPMQHFDKVTLLATVAALVLWVTLPDGIPTGLALLVVGILQAIRLARWKGARTTSEPLLLVLHAGYVLVPLGAILIGAAVLWPTFLDAVAAQHIWMAGAIGMMTMAMMTRATLGHSGQPLRANHGTSAIYLALLLSVALRFFSPATDLQLTLQTLSGALWIAAFGGFTALYGPYLLSPRSK